MNRRRAIPGHSPGEVAPPRTEAGRCSRSVVVLAEMVAPATRETGAGIRPLRRAAGGGATHTVAPATLGRRPPRPPATEAGTTHRARDRGRGRAGRGRVGACPVRRAAGRQAPARGEKERGGVTPPRCSGGHLLL